MSENYFKRGKTNCWPFQGAAEDAPNAESKMACDNPICCNPRHVVEVVENDDNNDDDLDIDSMDDEQIKAILDRHEIQYRSNASTEALKQALEILVEGGAD